jgi:hypothetical protein
LSPTHLIIMTHSTSTSNVLQGVKLFEPHVFNFLLLSLNINNNNKWLFRPYISQGLHFILFKKYIIIPHEKLLHYRQYSLLSIGGMSCHTMRIIHPIDYHRSNRFCIKCKKKRKRFGKLKKTMCFGKRILEDPLDSLKKDPSGWNIGLQKHFVRRVYLCNVRIIVQYHK